METLNMINEDIYRAIIDIQYAGSAHKEDYGYKIKEMVNRFRLFLEEEIELKKKVYNDDVKIIIHEYVDNERKIFHINRYQILDEVELLDELTEMFIKEKDSPTYGKILELKCSLLVNLNTNDLTILSTYLWKVIKIVPNAIFIEKNIPKFGNYFDIMPIYSRLGENIKYRENDYI